MPARTTGRGGHDVFEILVREHADMLTAYLRSILWDTNAVDDVFQETMLVAWRRLDDYDRQRPFGPWLRGIAARLVLQHRRKAARGGLSCAPEVLAALDARFETMTQMPGDSFRNRVDRLLECLKKLPEKLRTVIELTYAREIMLRQVALAVGSSEEAVKKRVQRGRQLLADCLQSSESHV